MSPTPPRPLLRSAALLLLVLATCTSPTTTTTTEIAAQQAGVGYRDRAIDTIRDFAVDKTLSQFPNVKKGMKWGKNAKNVYDHVRDYQRCVDQGKDADGCKAKLIRWGVCWLVNWGANKLMAPEFAMLGLPIEQLCNGEPTLKCCRYFTIEPEGQCHSAFNTAKPINCEGNPWGGETFGVCMPRNAYPGDPGCLCDYLPQCPSPGGGVQNYPGASGWREAFFLERLADAIPAAIEGDSTHPPDYLGFADYVTLTGCAAHRGFLADSEPFGIPAPLPTGLALPSHYTDPIEPDALLMRNMITVAVRRVAAGIPNLAARWNYVDSRTFTDAERTAYLSTIGDPATILGRQLGPFGLRMLQIAHPKLWPLLAVPLPTESPTANEDWPYVGACTPGAPPLVALTPTVTAADVSVRVDLQDPQENSDDLRLNAMVVDWGDGVVDQLVRFVDDPASHVAKHTYRTPGAREIHVWVANAAGLVGEASTTITATDGVPGAFTDSQLAIGTITLDMDATISSQIQGWVSVDVSVLEPKGDEHAAGRLFRKPNPAPLPFSEAVYPLRDPLPNSTESLVAGLRLRPKHYTDLNPNTGTLRLGAITLGRRDGTTFTWKPTANDVQVWATGATTPTSPTRGPTGMLEMPVFSKEIVIRVPPIPRDTWCRSTFGATGAPAFRNAYGGCQDASTGLVWSEPSAAISWNDAVWDSALAGNAPPDASDNGRVADYTGHPAGPDASLVNYCHDLVQGGFSDWRLPSEAEVVAALGATKAGAFLATSGNVWTTESLTADYAVARDLTTGTRKYSKKVDREIAVCVRGPVTTSLAAIGAVCSADSACGTGHCVDGVCCNEACGGAVANDCYACSAAAGAVADGICSALDARPCDDAWRCSTASACSYGTCVATAWNPCDGPAATCETGAICVETTGACHPIPVADGTACDDANACSEGDSCHLGACTAAPITCPAIDACHEAGACDTASGACSTPAKPDGAACPGGTCRAGACIADPPDAGTPFDAGTPENTADAGSAADAGEEAIVDAGNESTADAGEPVADAGHTETSADAGEIAPKPDAGPIIGDAGTVPAADAGAPVTAAEGGCGCAGVDDLPFALAGLLALLRRRRNGLG